MNDTIKRVNANRVQFHNCWLFFKILILENKKKWKYETENVTEKCNLNSTYSSFIQPWFDLNNDFLKSEHRFTEKFGLWYKKY